MILKHRGISGSVELHFPDTYKISLDVEGRPPFGVFTKITGKIKAETSINKSFIKLVQDYLAATTVQQDSEKIDAEFREILANKLKQYRLVNDLTQKQLADRLKCSEHTICSIEIKRKQPSVALLIDIATLFNCSLVVLLTADIPSTIGE